MIVEVWQEGNVYVAATPTFNVHTFGDTGGEAVQDLYEYLPEYAGDLDAEGDKLAPWLADTRDRLNRWLAERRNR